jgi:hypothetical protein
MVGATFGRGFRPGVNVWQSTIANSGEIPAFFMKKMDFDVCSIEAGENKKRRILLIFSGFSAFFHA